MLEVQGCRRGPAMPPGETFKIATPILQVQTLMICILVSLCREIQRVHLVEEGLEGFDRPLFFVLCVVLLCQHFPHWVWFSGKATRSSSQCGHGRIME